MKSFSLPAGRPPAWRRIGAVLALAASLGFAFQSTLVMAQVASEPDVPAQAKPKTAKKKPAHKVTPTDNVADELNRREAERTAKAALEAAPAASANTETKAADVKLPEAKSAEAKSAETKPVETKPAMALPVFTGSSFGPSPSTNSTF